MWKNRLKELLYILENSNVNEIDVTFFGVRYRVVKEPSLHDDSSFSKEKKREDDSKESTVSTQKILVEDGNAVEFNQPLFIINPK